MRDPLHALMGTLELLSEDTTLSQEQQADMNVRVTCVSLLFLLPTLFPHRLLFLYIIFRLGSLLILQVFQLYRRQNHTFSHPMTNAFFSN